MNGHDLRAVIEDWPSEGGSDHRLAYRIGNEFTGETAAAFGADGSYELWSTVTPGHEHREFTGHCDPAEIAALAALMAAEELWTVTHIDPRQREDDSLVVLEAGDGERSGRVELWLSEVPRVPGFARVQEALLELVRRLSGGVILEEGR